MNVKDSLLAAAEGLPYALNVTDCDLRNDRRFDGKGVVVPAQKAGEYGIDSGEELEARDHEGKPTNVLFLRLAK